MQAGKINNSFERITKKNKSHIQFVRQYTALLAKRLSTNRIREEEEEKKK